MNFWRFWQRRNGRGSFNKGLLSLDLLSHLSYMSAIATTGVPRGVVFEEASRLPYVSSRYFSDVSVLCGKLNYDYAEACQLVGKTVQEEEAKSLLLRLSSSLSAGEPEMDFLNREAHVQAESYGNEYERQLESTKKWTDSYVALIVSAALIIIVAVISMMIYQVGITFILSLAGLTIAVTMAGSWIISRAAPQETKTHSLPELLRGQRIARVNFKVMLTLVVIAGALLGLVGMPLSWIMLTLAILVSPVGLFSMWDDRRIDKRDADIASFLRALGGVTKAIGTTVTEALSRIDTRATGSLASEVKKLNVRLASGIAPDLCWRRFVAETGSELVDRTVRIFWDGISRGGDPEEVGNRASFFAMKIALLRAKRRMVGATFGWLSIPMHGAITALLIFIVNIMALFGKTIGEAQVGERATSSHALAVGANLGGFQGADMALLSTLVMVVMVVLTISNAYAVKAAEGGHSNKLFYHLAIMMTITGVTLLLVPAAVDMIFGSISASAE